VIKIKRLNIFIDESGDFGFVKGSSDLYAVSFTLHESSDSIENELKYLNEKLKELNYDGMIHLAYLVAKRGDYSHFDFERRKSIFWAIFYFSNRVKVKIKTVIIDKKYINKKMQLNMALAREIGQFINDNKDYLESFDKIVIYYDNGQETLATILDTIFATNSKVERRIEFDHKEKRLFQVSDMLTVIDKLDYKRKNNIPFTNAEEFFFRGKDFRKFNVEDKRLQRLNNVIDKNLE
jgi:hypothetical protein